MSQSLLASFMADDATTSPRALILEAFERRRTQDPAWTQARLSEASGVTQGNLSALLSGRTGEPRPDTTRRLLRAMGFGLALVEVEAAVHEPASNKPDPNNRHAAT